MKVERSGFGMRNLDKHYDYAMQYGDFFLHDQENLEYFCGWVSHHGNLCLM
jgi:hypothetical protein